jgi:hypothetical protein
MMTQDFDPEVAAFQDADRAEMIPLAGANWEPGDGAAIDAWLDAERDKAIPQINAISLTYEQVKRGMTLYLHPPEPNADRDEVLEEWCRAEGLEPVDAAATAMHYRASIISSARHAGVDDPEVLDRLTREVVTIANYGVKYPQRIAAEDLPY